MAKNGTTRASAQHMQAEAIDTEEDRQKQNPLHPSPTTNQVEGMAETFGGEGRIHATRTLEDNLSWGQPCEQPPGKHKDQSKPQPDCGNFAREGPQVAAYASVFLLQPLNHALIMPMVAITVRRPHGSLLVTNNREISPAIVTPKKCVAHLMFRAWQKRG